MMQDVFIASVGSPFKKLLKPYVGISGEIPVWISHLIRFQAPKKSSKTVKTSPHRQSYIVVVSVFPCKQPQDTLLPVPGRWKQWRSLLITKLQEQIIADTCRSHIGMNEGIYWSPNLKGTGPSSGKARASTPSSAMWFSHV